MKKEAIFVFLLILVLSSCTKNIFQDNIEENPIDVIEENLTEPVITDTEVNEEIQEINLDEYPIQLSLEKIENSVKLTWTKYKGDYEFTSYKISRSVIDSNPYYPGHSLRKTIVDINETEYIDTLPERGISYYVVSAIGPLNEKTHSNPVMVEFPNPKETPDQDIVLNAVETKEGVMLTWNKYVGEFLFYKVVWTTDHPYPKYPDDSTIATIAYVNQTEYLHTKPDSGMNYYAVTIVRPYKSRFTSQRASVEIK